MPADLSSHVSPGALLAGRYRILRPLGGGGMADVFLAEDAALARLVAVKVLRPELARDEQFVERFRREAQAAAALGHPNIVAIFDRGTSDGLSFIVMEYVRGETLKERVRREGPLAPAEAVAVALQLLAGLQFAHERHVVHRDVTAQNVLIDDSGTVKIADFGIARVGTSGLTGSGARMGTVQYVSPEQATGAPTDERSDLYSLGVILYEMLTGRLPFTADSDVALAMKHAREDAPGPAQVVAGLPPMLDGITLKALAKDPARRYQTAAQFAADLRRVQQTGLVPDVGGMSGGNGRGAIGAATVAGGAAAGGAGATAPIAPAAAAAGAASPAVTPPSTTSGTEPTRAADVAPTRGAGAAPARVGDVAPTIVADAAPTRVVAAGPDSAPTRVAGARGGAARRARRRRRVTLVLAILLVLALAAGGYVLYRTFLTPLTPVPKVVGSSQSGAVSALQKDGFTVALHSAFSDKYADGYVVRQTPAAGSRLADGGKVHLWIRKGPVHVRLPDFRSQTPDQVATLLARYDLVSQRRRGASRTVAAGLVFSQRPAAGATVARGDTVAYWVSTGMPKAVIPDVVGSSYGSAKSDLQAAGFAVSLKTTIAFGELPGTVVSQAPLGGSKAREGSVVTIWVALF